MPASQAKPKQTRSGAIAYEVRRAPENSTNPSSAYGDLLGRIRCVPGRWYEAQAPATQGFLTIGTYNSDREATEALEAYARTRKTRRRRRGQVDKKSHTRYDSTRKTNPKRAKETNPS